MDNKITPDEKLNEVLKVLNHNNRHSSTHEDLMNKLDGKISINELDMILDQLTKDYYILKKPTYSINDIATREFKETNRKVYHITWEGKNFIEKGGYIQKYEDDKIELKYKNWSTYVLIYGGAAAGIYYIYQLLKGLCALLCHY